MKPLRFNYASEVDAETKELMRLTNVSKLELTELNLTCSALASAGQDYFHVVDVNYRNERYYFRVITGAGYGVTVVIKSDDEVLYEKYRDLRELIRNNDCVNITFPWIKVKCWHKNVLSLYTDDFKVVEEITRPTIYI